MEAILILVVLVILDCYLSRCLKKEDAKLTSKNDEYNDNEHRCHYEQDDNLMNDDCDCCHCGDED